MNGKNKYVAENKLDMGQSWDFFRLGINISLLVKVITLSLPSVFFAQQPHLEPVKAVCFQVILPVFSRK